MSFSVDDPYELIQIANSLDTGASESTLLLLMYMIQRFGELGTTVNQFPSIPRDEFDSVVRDDFEPRLLEVGTDSTSTGESLIGVAMTLKEFHNLVPQVKSAAANLEQVLNQSSSPAEWKSAAEPLASALNNLYSVKVPSAPSANESLQALAGKNVGTASLDDIRKPSSSEPDAQQSGAASQQPGGTPAAQQPAAKQQTSGASQPEGQSSGSGGGSSPSSGGGSGDGGQGGGSGGGSGGSPSSSPASSPAASDSGKKATNAAALSDSPFAPSGSTGLQSADLLPPSAPGVGLGGGGGGGFGAGLDPRTLGAAPGGAANPASSAGIPGAGPAGAARGMSSMMGGMMGPGMMGGRGGAGDKEHKAPDYLYSEDNGYELIEKLPVVSPDVIGALTEEEVEAVELHTDFAYSDQA